MLELQACATVAVFLSLPFPPRPLRPSPFLVRQLGWGVGGGRTEGGVEFRPLSLPRNLTATELSSAQKDIYFNAL